MARKVLIARGGALPNSTGLGRAHFNLIERFENGRIRNYELLDVVEHKLGGNPIFKLINRWFKHPRTVSKLIKTKSPDLLLITDQEQSHLIPKKSKIPSAVIVHDLFQIFPRIVESRGEKIEVGEKNVNSIRKRDINYLKKGLERADLIICISEATKKEVLQYWPNKSCHVVPHGIETSTLNPNNAAREKPSWLQKEKCNLIYVGTDDPRKRLEFALQIIGEMPDEIKKDIILHKIGIETNSSTLEKLGIIASDSKVAINWVGKLDDEDLFATYQYGDALIFPSIAEGFGLPPLEAMACGCPLIMADAPAHNEVSDEKFLLPPDDINAWKKRIETIHSDWSVRNGKERIANSDSILRAENFSVERWCSNLEDALSKL